MKGHSVVERAKLDFYKQVLRPDPSRTVVRPFELGYPAGFDTGASRNQQIVDRILTLDDAELARQFIGVSESLDEHHRDVDAMLMRRFDQIAAGLSNVAAIKPDI
eukprot:gene12244-16331_t